MTTARAVLFDLDDTLYPEMTFVSSGFRAVAEFVGPRVGHPPGALLERMMDILAMEGRGRVFDRLAGELGLAAADWLSTLLYVYRSHRPGITLPTASRELLSSLRRDGWRLGIVTDGMASVQRRKIEALGLEPLVDAIVCTDELGQRCWKPQPDGYRVALELLGVAAEGAFYVGDNPAKDFAWPNCAGMITVQVLVPGRDREQVEPSARSAHCIENLMALPDLLESLTAGRPASTR